MDTSYCYMAFGNHRCVCPADQLDGTTKSPWHNDGNWTNGVPTAISDVVIGDEHFTGGNEPTLLKTVICRSLYLGHGSDSITLTINSKNNITVQDDINIGSRGTIWHQATTISLTGNWVNKGNLLLRIIHQ